MKLLIEYSTMSVKDSNAKTQNTPRVSAPGDGIRQVKTTNVFRMINFELYARPVSIPSCSK